MQPMPCERRSALPSTAIISLSSALQIDVADAIVTIDAAGCQK
jgi:hypothetical protein